MSRVKSPVISIVVPTYNEEGNVKKLFDEVASVLDLSFEVIFVDDGSRDKSLEHIKKMAKKDGRVRYITFSRNFGHQAALRAGLELAVGEAVISMDADLQHPPKLLPKLIKEWEGGYDVVYTIREDDKRTSKFKRLTSTLFYKFINFMADLNIEEGAADFRLLDRKVVDVINIQHESELFMRGYVNWIGFKQLGIPYVPAERFSGQSKYTLKKMFRLAGQGITQFSVKPLRLSFILAGLAMALSCVYVIYAIAMALTGHTISGWLSIVTLLVFLQGTQFFILGMIGEYLARTFMQTKQRPEYIIAETNCEPKA